MDYNASPDLGPSHVLTPEVLALYQRFQQPADDEFILHQWDEEVQRHVRLVEVAIMYFARCGCRSCALPPHPIAELDAHVRRVLEQRGFVIEPLSTGIQSQPGDSGAETRATSVGRPQASWMVSWSCVSGRNERVIAEWQRREAIEEAELEENPPTPQSSVAAGKIESSRAVWAALLDDQYLGEVQRRHHRAFLLLFDLDGKCVHREPTTCAYGAIFGPDVEDVAEWQGRAMRIVAELRQSGATSS